jgi:CRP-like cAMP-binding protein
LGWAVSCHFRFRHGHRVGPLSEWRTVSPGDVFGWTGLVPPFIATAGAKTLTPCRIIAFDTKELMEKFEDDCRFGYVMTQKAAQVMRDRLHDMRIESLAYFQAE